MKKSIFFITILILMIGCVEEKNIKNSNNLLDTILVFNGSDLEPEFNSDTFKYRMNVDSNVEDLLIFAEPQNGNSTVKGTGRKLIKEGLNELIITVIAENDSKKEYTIIVNKKKNQELNNEINLNELEIIFDKKYLSLDESENQYKCEYKLIPDNATIKNIMWKSKSNSIATVDSNGVITAKKPGKTYVELEINGNVRDDIEIIVRSLPKNKFKIHYKTKDEEYEDLGLYIKGVPLNGNSDNFSIEIDNVTYNQDNLLKFTQKDDYGVFVEFDINEDKNKWDEYEIEFSINKDFSWVKLGDLYKVNTKSINEVWCYENNDRIFYEKPIFIDENIVDEFEITIDNEIKTKFSVERGNEFLLSLDKTELKEYYFIISDNNKLDEIEPGKFRAKETGEVKIYAVAGGINKELVVYVTPEMFDNYYRVHYFRYDNKYSEYYLKVNNEIYRFEDKDDYGAFVDIKIINNNDNFEIVSDFSILHKGTFESIVDGKEFWIKQGNYIDKFDIKPKFDIGGFKVINSWGDKETNKNFSWENKRNGFFNISYDAMKKIENICIVLKPKGKEIPYDPKAIAVFNVRSIPRRNLLIEIGKGDINNPKIVKKFNSFSSSYAHNGDVLTEYPMTDMALDVTELLPFENEEVWLKVTDSGFFLNNSLVSKFKIEIYESYLNNKIKDEFYAKSYIQNNEEKEINDLRFAIETLNGKELILKTTKINSNEILKSIKRNNYSKYSKSINSKTKKRINELFNVDNRYSEEFLYNIFTEKTTNTNEKRSDKLEIFESFDISQSDHYKMYLPPVGNQEHIGSCVGWALGYYVSTYNNAKVNDWDLSNATWERGEINDPFKDKIMSPNFIYTMANTGRDYGSIPYVVSKILVDIGISTIGSFPDYDVYRNSWPGEEAFREAPKFRANSEILVINSNDDLSITKIKEEIFKGNLVMIGINANNFENFDNKDFLGFNDVDKYFNHAVTIVGYDDNMNNKDK